MKKRWSWWQVIGLTINLIGAVFLSLCIFTDINDDLFLPCALICVMSANLLQLIFNIRGNRKPK